MFNSNFGAILPMMNGEAPKTNIKVLLDGGAYTCGTYDIIEHSNSTVSNNTFPHLSHWDKPFDPTFDINFGQCDFYFRNDNFGATTNNNLFNLHWRRTLNQINTGRLLTAHFNLSELDIQKMELSDKIRIDNSWWNINKIVDYDANSNNLTKVELLSIDDLLEIPFLIKDVGDTTTDSSTTNAATDGVYSQWSRQNNKNESLSNGAIYGYNNTLRSSYQGGLIVGNNNIVDDTAIIQGSNNQVFASGLVMGDSNIVNPQAVNSFVLGDNIEVVESNTLYSQNIIIPSGGTFNGTPATNILSNNTKKFTEIEIGDWDMVATITVTVAHSLSATEWKTIRQVSVMVRDDTDVSYSVDFYVGKEGGINPVDSTNFNLTRTGGGIYVSTSFDSTSYNRGWVTFWYTPDNI
jgi:hypothetical protein